MAVNWSHSQHSKLKSRIYSAGAQTDFQAKSKLHKSMIVIVADKSQAIYKINVNGWLIFTIENFSYVTCCPWCHWWQAELFLKTIKSCCKNTKLVHHPLTLTHHHCIHISNFLMLIFMLMQNREGEIHIKENERAKQKMTKLYCYLFDFCYHPLPF